MGGFFKKIGQGLGITKSGSESQSEKALKLFDKIQTPVLRKLALEKYAAVADPREFLTALKDTDLKNIQLDPATRGAQMTALGNLQNIADHGGLTPEDQKFLNDIKTQQKVTEQGQRGAITQNAQARGVAGSGLEQAALLNAEQGGANSAAVSGTDVAANAQARAERANLEAAQLGGQIHAQDYGEASDAARAQDIINSYNTNAQNQAGLTAWQNQQSLANANTDIANKQTTYNTQMLPQQNFENKLTLAQQQAAALNKLGVAQDAQTGNLMGIIQGVTGGQSSPINPNNSNVKDAAAGFAAMSDERLKEDIEDGKEDVTTFLESLSPSAWKYKNKKFGKGKHAGPMAQEMEKTEVGKAAVIETPEGKALHPGKSASLALASVRVLHDRLKKLESKRA